MRERRRIIRSSANFPSPRNDETDAGLEFFVLCKLNSLKIERVLRRSKCLTNENICSQDLSVIFVCYRFRRSVSLIPHPQWVRGRRGGERLPLFDNTELILSDQTGGVRNGKAKLISKEIWNVVLWKFDPDEIKSWIFLKPRKAFTSVNDAWMLLCSLNILWAAFELSRLKL